jgi:hypothetical protein
LSPRVRSSDELRPSDRHAYLGGERPYCCQGNVVLNRSGRWSWGAIYIGMTSDHFFDGRNLVVHGKCRLETVFQVDTVFLSGVQGRERWWFDEARNVGLKSY